MPSATEDQVRQRIVLESRYIDGEKWPMVTWLIYGEAENYEDKQESFLRLTNRIHDRALKSLSEILMEDIQ